MRSLFLHYEHTSMLEILMNFYPFGFFSIFFRNARALCVCVCGGYFESVDPLAFWALFRQLGKLISLPFFHLLPHILDDSKYASIFFLFSFGLKRTDDELRSLVFFVCQTSNDEANIYDRQKSVRIECVMLPFNANARILTQYTHGVWRHMKTESHVLC